MQIKQLFILAFFACILHKNAIAQNDSLKKIYPFLKLESNQIENQNELGDFFKKLSGLSQKKKSKVSIVHIGDSHIQADFFSGTLRQGFQKKFGNAGRGLVFPHRAAGSNESYSIQSTASGNWKSGRNAVRRDTMPTGIAGFSLYSRDTVSSLKLILRPAPGLDYGFTRMKLFWDKGNGNIRPLISLLDSSGISLASFELKNPEYSLESAFKANSLRMSFATMDTTPAFYNFFGFYFENGDPGILYNTIGVNGAEFRHFACSEIFLSQVPELKPDLIIISMGTNEAFGKNFNPENFYHQIDSLVSRLKKDNPQSDFLFTTPGDSFRGRKYKNPRVQIARNVIINYCLKNNHAYWDLYQVMGGYGSMAKWFSKGLSAKDRLHFNRRGYELQGSLLFKAFENGFAGKSEH